MCKKNCGKFIRVVYLPETVLYERRVLSMVKGHFKWIRTKNEHYNTQQNGGDPVVS